MAAVPAAASARVPDSTRVVGGTTVTGVDPAPYPFMAALVFKAAPNDRAGQFCGGSLIAHDRVLTAAHCALGFEPADIVVVVGRKRLTAAGGQRVGVSGFAVDPSYDPDAGTNDAALVFLSSPVGGPDATIATVGPSPSPTDDALWAPGLNLTVSGWGAITPDGNTFPNDLQQGAVARQADNTCAADYAMAPIHFDAASELCANGPATDACFGDSGGPLFTQGATPLEVGIVSFGAGTCLDSAHPAVYARLGSPSINAFVHSVNPVVQPVPTANPSIGPAPVVGTASSCTGAQFGGSPATDQATVWGRLTGNTIEAVGSDTTYTPSNADLGHSLVCAVVALNAGGLGIAQSDPSPAVVAPGPAPAPSVAPSSSAIAQGTETVVGPAPGPVPTGAAVAAARAAILNRMCVRRRCTFAIAVSNATDATAITATLTPAPTCRKPHRAGARRRCKRHKPIRLTARRVAHDRFTLTTGRLKPGKYTLAVQATNQVVPTMLRVRVR